VVEWSRALDVRLSEWCCSVSMVWVQNPSREKKNLTALRSNSNTLWFNFQTYIYVYIYTYAKCDVFNFICIVYNSIQHYVIKVIIDLREVGGFLRVLRLPAPIILIATIYLKYC
jgi:hypothetical protein